MKNLVKLLIALTLGLISCNKEDIKPIETQTEVNTDTTEAQTNEVKKEISIVKKNNELTLIDSGYVVSIDNEIVKSFTILLVNKNIPDHVNMSLYNFKGVGSYEFTNDTEIGFINSISYSEDVTELYSGTFGKAQSVKGTLEITDYSNGTISGYFNGDVYHQTEGNYINISGSFNEIKIN